MDNKLHYAHTFFCSHLAAVGRASEVQAADKRWQAEKPLTRDGLRTAQQHLLREFH